MLKSNWSLKPIQNTLMPNSGKHTVPPVVTSAITSSLNNSTWEYRVYILVGRDKTMAQWTFDSNRVMKRQALSKQFSITFDLSLFIHGPLTRWAKLSVGRALGMPGTFSPPRLQRNPLVSDPDMHHGTCVTHVPWCMSGSLTRGGGENVPDIPSACATRNFAYLVRGPRQNR